MRMKPTLGGKACGFPALRGLSAAPLGLWRCENVRSEDLGNRLQRTGTTSRTTCDSISTETGSTVGENSFTEGSRVQPTSSPPRSTNGIRARRTNGHLSRSSFLRSSRRSAKATRTLIHSSSGMTRDYVPWLSITVFRRGSSTGPTVPMSLRSLLSAIPSPKTLFLRNRSPSGFWIQRARYGRRKTEPTSSIQPDTGMNGFAAKVAYSLTSLAHSTAWRSTC